MKFLRMQRWYDFYPYGEDGEEFFQGNADREIKNSSVIETSFRVEDGKIHGRVKVKDIRALFQSLPEFYWDMEGFYRIGCLSYNDFSSSGQHLAELHQPGKEK